MSSASSSTSSPTTTRSGLSRRVSSTSWRVVISPSPSALECRVNSAGASGWRGSSSRPEFEQVLLDRDDPLQWRDRAEQLGEQRRLAGAGRSGDEDREAAPHQGAELVDDVMREQAEVGEPVEADLTDDESTDRQAGMGRDPVLVATAEHHHDARSVDRLQREHRRRRVEPPLAGAGHPQRHPLLERREFDGARPQLSDVDLAPIGVGDPRREVAVDVDLLHVQGRSGTARVVRTPVSSATTPRPQPLLGRLIERTKPVAEPILVQLADLVADPRADEQLLPSDDRRPSVFDPAGAPSAASRSTASISRVDTRSVTRATSAPSRESWWPVPERVCARRNRRHRSRSNTKSSSSRDSPASSGSRDSAVAVPWQIGTSWSTSGRIDRASGRRASRFA